MNTEVKQKTVDLLFTTSESGQLQSAVVPEGQPREENDKVLRLHFSLMGKSTPNLSPLAADYVIDDKATVYRYDWIVGASLISPCYKWDWYHDISEQRALVIQLLLDAGESGCGFSESNAFLLGLQPSKDTSSWVERNSEKLGENLAKLSSLAEPFNRMAANILKTSAVMSSFVASDEKGGKKNWFVYRFLDEKRKCCAVEWNINRTVLHQYGSVLRGSILLAFHGSGPPESPLSLLLRPRLNFGGGPVGYLPPPADLETQEPVLLEIRPKFG